MILSSFESVVSFCVTCVENLSSLKSKFHITAAPKLLSREVFLPADTQSFRGWDKSSVVRRLASSGNLARGMETLPPSKSPWGSGGAFPCLLPDILDPLYVYSLIISPRLRPEPEAFFATQGGVPLRLGVVTEMVAEAIVFP